MMKIGKLPESVLQRSIIKQVKHRRDEVLMGPSVGVDCAAVSLKADEVLVMSTDPITGTAKDVGRHCVHITANDLAASGAEPLGIMLTVLLPPTIEEPEIRKMVQDAEQACASLNMEILGGHTEITNAVQQPLITVTGIGKVAKDQVLLPENIRAGEDVIVTKWIGLEATTILAKEREEQLSKRFSANFIHTAQRFDQYLSVVEDAAVAKSAGVTAMHDITEGGVFGALWEMAEAGHTGLEINLRAIPIKQETVEICEFFNANPYQIMSSGSMMIVSKHGQEVVNALERAGIHATIIGQTTAGNDRILRNGEDVRYLDRPQPDELYKALENIKII